MARSTRRASRSSVPWIADPSGHDHLSPTERWSAAGAHEDTDQPSGSPVGDTVADPGRACRTRAPRRVECASDTRGAGRWRCRESVASFDISVSGAIGCRQTREDGAMKYMLLQSYGAVESDCPPMSEWAPGDIATHIRFQQALNQELIESGELLDAQGLSTPELAKSVVSDGLGVPVVTDGPFPESKELLAGYRIVEVATAERAIEIAAKISAAPGAGGAAIRQPIEVREVMEAPDPDRFAETVTGEV